MGRRTRGRLRSRPSTRRRSFHQCEIPPEVLQTIRAAEQGGEICRVHKHDVAVPLLRPVAAKMPTASSVYLSKSVSKMPMYWK